MWPSLPSYHQHASCSRQDITGGKIALLAQSNSIEAKWHFII
jgi:hypothetical protein